VNRVITLLLSTTALIVATLASLSLPGAASAATDPPRWIVPCTVSKIDAFDPIVFPGVEPPIGHTHVFLGGDVQPTTTFQGLRAGTTTCQFLSGQMPNADKAGYWFPEGNQYDTPLAINSLNAYYRRIPAVPAATVKPFPNGLRMISGDSHATGAQPQVQWTCSGGGSIAPGDGYTSPSPHDCGPGSLDPDRPNVRVKIDFPECGNGKKNSKDHKRHMAFASSTSGCPASHPQAFPRLRIGISFQTSDGDGITLSSGPPETMHADFFDGWDKNTMQLLIDRCLADGATCDNKGQLLTP
jgi:hypothetical protein